MDEKYSLLNDRQREAVFHTEGPLLILAGAGSGKTRVLTHRVAYLIEECHVPPHQIMAITFTNKAAEEMKTRVNALVEFSDAVWVMTFHSTCVRILRRHIDRLGYKKDFVIYDADDQRAMIRHIVRDMELDTKVFRERDVAAKISAYKNEMLDSGDMAEDAVTYADRKNAEIFAEYERRMKAGNTVDFDDLQFGSNYDPNK